MTESVKRIADMADMIVNGYAFTRTPQGYRILNLNAPEHAALLSPSGEMMSTSMDNIELGIVQEYLSKNRFLLEDDNA